MVVGELKSAPQDLPTLEVDATYGPVSLREFDVSLTNFTGPFDLLLRLIASRQMDLTEVALAAVTDEFLGYIRRYPDLTSATDFLVVAATLLHMKAASLLPRVGDEDELAEEDLEARDLLFARLLQYRALQEAAAVLARCWEASSGTAPRLVPLQEPYASMLPELRWSLTKVELAQFAAEALAERPRPDIVICFTDGDTPWPSAPPPGAVVIAAILGRRGFSLPPTPQWATRVECLVDDRWAR